MKKKSGESDAPPATKRKGGRPRKTAPDVSRGDEAWKPIVNPKSKRDYQVSSRGEVRRTLANGKQQILKPWFSGPYECYYLYGVEGVTNKYGRKKVYEHRLVADHFVKKEKGKPFVHHKDGRERNNAASNLDWVTLHENLKARKYFYEKDGKVLRKKRAQKEKKKAEKVKKDEPKNP